MSRQTKHFYDFGPYRVDTVKRTLLKEGSRVSLTPKAFDTLLALVESDGQIIAKEELMRRVWPDSFVEEGNLAVNISMLRKALGETPHQHQFIVTIPGRGYRFVARVHEIQGEGADIIVEEQTRARVVIKHEEHESLEQESISDEDTRLATDGIFAAILLGLKRRWKYAAVAVAALALILAAAIWNLFPRQRAQSVTDWRYSLRLIQLAGSKSERNKMMGSGRFSPDGRMLVFCSPGDGFNILIMQLEGGNTISIVQDRWNNESPIWSPDGQRIAFISNRGDQVGIWTVPLLGGQPKLLKTLEPSAPIMEGGLPALKHWASNGAIYYEANHNLYMVDADSKEIIQITTFDPSTQSPTGFRLSPDEKRIAYVEESHGQFDIWRMQIRGGTPVQVTDDSAVERLPVWHPDGNKLIYSSKRDGKLRICMAYLDGQPSAQVAFPEQITFMENDGYVWDISPDGSKILYTEKKDESDLWEVNLETHKELQITADNGMEFWPDVSSGGSLLAFQTIQGGGMAWDPMKSALVTLDLPPAGRAAQVAADAFEPRLSPDGKKIAFLRRSDGQINLWCIKAIGGEEKQITTGGVTFGGQSMGPPYNIIQTEDFSWSPDGGKIVYCSKKDGAANAWMISVDGSDEIKLSTNIDSGLTFNCPMWSPDGRQVAFISSTTELPSGGKQIASLWVADQQKSEIIFQTDSILRLIGWSSSGSELIVGTAQHGGLNRAFPTTVDLSRIFVATRDKQHIATVEEAYLANIHLSPDARAISLVAAKDGSDNIWILPLLGGEPRKMTNNSDPRVYFSSLAWSPDATTIYYGRQERWSLIKVLENFR